MKNAHNQLRKGVDLLANLIVPSYLSYYMATMGYILLNFYGHCHYHSVTQKYEEGPWKDLIHNPTDWWDNRDNKHRGLVMTVC